MPRFNHAFVLVPSVLQFGMDGLYLDEPDGTVIRGAEINPLIAGWQRRLVLHEREWAFPKQQQLFSNAQFVVTLFDGGTMRMPMLRSSRLTNALSKKIENHAAMVALYFMYYNFGRVHQTLRVTPAMAKRRGHGRRMD